MTILAILFFFSLGFLSWGFTAVKATYEELNALMTKIDTEKWELSTKQINFCVIGLIVGVIGAVLYYQVGAATIEDIVTPRNPVENPIPYGIALIISSIIFSGGLFCIPSALEEDTKFDFIKVCLTAATVLLVIYLVLKSFMVLP